jgi:hypothetical protein
MIWFFGGVVLGFELRASPLLGRYSITSATPSALFFCVLGIFKKESQELFALAGFKW